MALRNDHFLEACASILSKTPGWERSPAQAQEILRHSLNTILEDAKFYRYRHGFPRPSVTVKNLEGAKGRAETAARTKNTAPLIRRLGDLKEREEAAFDLLLAQLAISIDFDRVEQLVNDPQTHRKMFELATHNPAEVAEMADRALINLRPLVSADRLEKRNKGKRFDRELVIELGLLFQKIAGRAPGITIASARKDEREIYTGPFIEFAKLVFHALDRTKSGRSIMNALRELRQDFPEWDRGERPRWKGSFD